MPLREGGFASIISFPPRPGKPEFKGNAELTIITNQFFPGGDTYGAHAVWLIFNMEEVVSKVSSSDGGPPIWRFNPRVHDMRVNSHLVIHTNNAMIFWNGGRTAARNEDGEVIVENGHPKIRFYRPPLDKGFVEGDYRPSSELLSSELKIHRSGVLTTYRAVPDEKLANGLRMVVVLEQQIESKELVTEPLLESFFVPQWTNQFAVVADPRREGNIPGQPLTYITRSNSFNASEEELDRRKRENDMMHAVAQPQKSPPRSFAIPILLFITIIPLAIWWRSRSR